MEIPTFRMRTTIKYISPSNHQSLVKQSVINSQMLLLKNEHEILGLSSENKAIQPLSMLLFTEEFNFFPDNFLKWENTEYTKQSK